MMVYVIDVRADRVRHRTLWTHLLAIVIPWSRDGSVLFGLLPRHEDAKLLMVQPQDVWADVVRRVIDEVETAWTIYMLRLVAHGSSGYIEMGKGIRRPQARDFRSLAHFMTPARYSQVYDGVLGEAHPGREQMGDGRYPLSRFRQRRAHRACVLSRYGNRKEP